MNDSDGWGRGWIRLAIVAGLVLGGGPSLAQMSESFEFGVPPPGWTKTNLLGGSGWYQLPIGIMPLPGWGNGTSSVPATANAGTHNAYCSWDTGGGASEGYHNDQWLISPRLTGLTATSTVSYWLRFNFTNFPDTVYFRVSTNGPAPANFTFVPLTNVFAKGSYTNQFPPWSNHVVNVGALGIPAGTPIWIAIQEYVWDNTWNGAAVQLDVINSDLTAPPQPWVGPTSLAFWAYYDGANPASQTFALQGVGSSGMDYSGSLAFGPGPTNWLTIGGPPAGTLPYQQSQTFTASVSAVGLDLGTYYATNVITVPGATNSPLRVSITLNVIRRPQAIAFPNPGPQYTTNRVGLAGTASSGLPVTFSVFSGPGIVTEATNLSFTGTGTVRVAAWQLGNIYYDVAPCVTQAMAVTKPNAAISFSALSHVYDGAPHGATVTTDPPGLTVDTTYNGSASLPVAIGSYAVTSTVNDAIYGGTATATYTITRMVQTVDFPDPGAQWTTSVVGLAAAASSGLPVAFSVASGLGTISGGTNLSFTGAGVASVVATQAGDADWLPAAATNSITVSKAAASVTLGSLAQTYDGTAKSASATTDPAGLAVDLTYDGLGIAPANAGSYAVTGTINDAMYQGAGASTLTIAKGAATVALTNLSPTYDGTPRNAAATTVPASLTVDFTYDGSTNAPVARGSYAVTGIVNDANWQGVATGTLTIGMGAATVTLENLAQAYDGTPKHATAETVPAGLAVDFTYDGETNGPVAVGSHVVTGTVNDADWAGSSTGTLVIGKGAAAIAFGGLSQVYDGAPKSATATTVPAALAVDLTYDGSPDAPSAVGSYAVTGSVNDANWQGTNTATLVIAKQPAAVFLADLAQEYDGSAKSATATTMPAGLVVEFTYDGAAAPPITAGVYVVTGRIDEANWQGAATDLFTIAKAPATVTLGDLTQVHDGTPKSVTATTVPAGLAVDFTYAGSTDPPVAAGSYAVTGTVNAVNWQGLATGTLVIAQGTAGVVLGGLAQVYTGTPRPATATTDPAGLAVDFTYDGSTNAPIAQGSYAVTGTVNDANWQGAATGTLTIGMGAAVIEFGGLYHLYDGTPKSATATTVPSGLVVAITYDGDTNLPVAIGAYAVTGTVNDANWQGSNTAILVIDKALATVTLDNLEHGYDGTSKSATATTVPPGLTVGITYDGSATAPAAAGVYAVTGTVDDVGYQGSATGILRIAKALATVTLGDLAQVHDGTPRFATATTDPAGLAVDFTYAGSTDLPVAAGSYAVTGTVNAANWQGLATGTLVIAKGAAEIVLGGLAQAYTGTPRPATATTDPADLAVDFTYDGSMNAPTARGSYAVTGTVNDANWQGAATGTLTIGMGAATVALDGLEQVYDGTEKNATATTVPAGLVVDFTYAGATHPPLAAGLYAVTGTVNDADWAGAATGTLMIGKGAATVTLGGLAQVYDGTGKSATATTVPPGLAVDLTYDGEPVLPVAIGSYAVTGTVNDANWQGADSDTLVIAMAFATVTLGDLTHVYDGTAKHATATTDPPGLAVDLTYDGAATAPTVAGSYAVRGTVNDAVYKGTTTGILTIAKAPAATTLGDLAQVYDGTPKAATAATVPAGLAVEFTYAGETNRPVAAGLYAVTGTVNDANWHGLATGTLVIAKAAAAVALNDLAHVYDGTARHATVATIPPGLAANITYDGSPAAPVAAGSYAVTGTVADANYAGTATGVLAIAKGAATVILGDLAHGYDGTAKRATATTVPPRLAVDFTYAGETNLPIAAGAYAVTGIVNEANWQGSATGTLAIGRGVATLAIAGLFHVYDGMAKNATATTVPAGLAVAFTYAGETNLPVAAGAYAVTGVVNDANWQGAATGILAIAKATQAILEFVPADGAHFPVGGGVALSARAASGLAVGFINLTPEVVNLSGSQATFLSSGLARIQAVQNGDANWNPAAPVTHAWTVGSLIAGVTPARANVGGGIEVRVHGFGLGAGGDVSAVRLAGVPAAILSQSATEVRVRAGPAAAAGIGDVTVVFASGGTLVLGHAFEYLWLAPPELLAPAEVRLTSLLARWRPAPGATGFLLDVGLDGNFAAGVSGYENLDVGFVQERRVTGLAPGTRYAIRLFARNADGFSLPSRTLWTSTAAPTPGDVDGDGRAELAVFYPPRGDWYFRLSSTGKLLRRRLGGKGTVPVPADYDGDGLADLAAYQVLRGNWRIRGSRAGVISTLCLGGRGALPVAGDYDGDGRSDPAIFRPDRGRWEIQGSAAGRYGARFGLAGWQPVPGDFEGDGVTDLGVLRPDRFDWHVLRSSSGKIRRRHLGWRTTLPVAADYDGDGRTDYAVYYPARGDWYILRSRAGTVRRHRLGGPGMIPVPADYDGDGAVDLAVYQSRTGDWWIRRSSTGRVIRRHLGWAGTVPVRWMP